MIQAGLECAGRRILWPFLALCLLSACAYNPAPDDPRTYPYSVHHRVWEKAKILQAVDLNGDGRDEIVSVHETPGQPTDAHLERLLLKTLSGDIIDQVNFNGYVRPVFMLDTDDDGHDELFVPYHRNDSLFVTVRDSNGQLRKSIFLISGKPRLDPKGSQSWDPNVLDFYLVDIDSDGKNELVTDVFTGYGRLPRGLLIHRFPEGKLLEKKIIGVMGPSFLDDFDGDGAPEVVTATRAVDNGANLGGFDDQKAYFLLFDIIPALGVTRSIEIGGKWAEGRLYYRNFWGDGKPELLLVVTNDNPNTSASIELIEPGTWHTLRKRDLNGTYSRWHAVADMDRDGYPELLVIQKPDVVEVFNHHFEVLRRIRFPHQVDFLYTLPDMDGDGIAEVVIYASDLGRITFLNPDLTTKAFFVKENLDLLNVPSGGEYTTVILRGVGRTPLLLVKDWMEPFTLELVPNPLFWYYRWGGMALWVLGAGLGMGLVVQVARRSREARLLVLVRDLALEDAPEGFLLLDALRRIRWGNNTAWRLLGVEQSGRRRPTADVLPPPLVDWLDAVQAAKPPHHHEDRLTIEREAGPVAFRVRTDPVRVGRRVFWLLCLREVISEDEDRTLRTWAMMARKVTHDIKNPLTGILLTAQRLQDEYHRNGTDKAPLLDDYVEKIIARVMSLRHMTRQYMKTMGEASLELAPTDVRRLVLEAREHLEGFLPPGITFTLNLRPDLPPVLADREQLLSVLENLIVNAVQAMHGQGALTISAYPVLNLPDQPADGDEPAYVVLEIQDTGAGIPEAERQRIFEPGYTTKEFGNGLGLALARHVLDQHHGRLEVESEVGVGSVFSLYLPRFPHKTATH